MIGLSNHARDQLRKRFGLEDCTYKEVSEMVRGGVPLSATKILCGEMVFVLRERKRGKGKELIVVTVLNKRD